MNRKRISEKARAIIDRIRALNIPRRAKAELLLLWHCARWLAEAAVGFVVRHRHLGECLALGAAVAYLVSHIPSVGGFLALMALVTAAAVGLMVELMRELEAVFNA